MSVTYEYYINEYYGDYFTSETEFNRYKRKAYHKIIYLIGHEISDEDYAEYTDSVNMAICATAEIIAKIDKATTNVETANGGSGIVKSMSSGGESISFDNASSLINSVLADKKAQNQLIYDTIKEYLTGTGLLFQGL